MPTSSLGTATASLTSQSSGGSSVTPTARTPATSESSQNSDLPRSMATLPRDHPAGYEATHGTEVASGTDWATSTMTSSVPHVGEPSIPRSCPGVNMLTSAGVTRNAPSRSENAS